jgi:uncharacterized protein YdeI (YjbR/CyaY-like superfamily)
MKPNELKLDFDTINQWQEWLNEHHLEDFVVYLRIKKTKTNVPGILLKDAIIEMLKFGWIDGRKNSIDENYFMIRCTKRKSNSVWSMINRNYVEELIKVNQMRPKGLEMVEFAKQSGAWDAAYSTQTQIIIPDDLNFELNKDIRSKETFDQYSNSDKMQLIFWINQAKRPETRIKRISRLIQLASEGKRITQL